MVVDLVLDDKGRDSELPRQLVNILFHHDTGGYALPQGTRRGQKLCRKGPATLLSPGPGSGQHGILPGGGQEIRESTAKQEPSADFLCRRKSEHEIPIVIAGCQSFQ